MYKNQEYSIELSNFSGPMDLLLYLAKSNELEISLISLEELIDSYLDFIKVQDLDLNFHASFLKMACELIYIKSRYLLPSSDQDTVEDEDFYSPDQLIFNLQEYQKFKDIKPKFESLINIRNEKINIQQQSFDNYKLKPEKVPLSTFIKKTASWTNKIEKNNQPKKSLILKQDRTQTIIEDLIKLQKEYSLDTLLKLDKEDSIQYFISILESIKRQYISLSYMDNDIIIKPKKESNE